MFNFVISELKTINAKSLSINTSSDECYEPAVKFYLKMGFERIDIKYDFYGNGEHQLIMSRNLDE